MPKSYHHLTYEQRCQIYTLKGRSKSLSEIARIIGVHRSSVSREMKRNSNLNSYNYIEAQQKAYERKAKRIIPKPVLNRSMIDLVESNLKLNQWSPQQIAGRLKREGRTISHETIYKHIWDDKKKNGNLYKYLRRKGKIYQKRGSQLAGRGFIPNRVDIDKRPSIVDKKVRFGDFEIDTIIGTGQSGAIVSIVDKASKFTKLGYVFNKTVEQVEATSIKNQLLGVVKFNNTYLFC
jgi:IS30 family transposase